MKLSRPEISLCRNALNEMLSGWAIQDIVVIAGSVQAVESLHARLEVVLLPEGDRSSVDVELSRSERGLLAAALEECLRNLGQGEKWDFAMRMGGWPHEAAHLVQRLKQE